MFASCASEQSALTAMRAGDPPVPGLTPSSPPEPGSLQYGDPYPRRRPQVGYRRGRPKRHSPASSGAPTTSAALARWRFGPMSRSSDAQAPHLLPSGESRAGAPWIQRLASTVRLTLRPAPPGPARRSIRRPAKRLRHALERAAAKARLPLNSRSGLDAGQRRQRLPCAAGSPQLERQLQAVRKSRRGRPLAHPASRRSRRGLLPVPRGGIEKLRCSCGQAAGRRVRRQRDDHGTSCRSGRNTPARL